MPNPVVTAKSIRWDCNLDDIFIEASYDKPSSEWVYVVLKGNTAIIPKIKNGRAPDDNSPRGRDMQMRAALSKSTENIDVDDVMKSFFDFSIKVGNVSEIIYAHINPAKQKMSEHSRQHVDEAMNILINGDPVKYILDTFASMHKGDYNTAVVLLVSIATQSILNSDGIHPTLSGESGKGKSHVCQTILHLVPGEYWMDTSLSAKAMFYAGVKPGIIVFSDDVHMGEELETTIKRATSNFQNTTTHMTVDSNRRVIELKIPPRISWWLANVDSDMSAQTINRQFGVTIDESSEMDDAVRDFQLEKAKVGEVKFPTTDEVLICREIMRIIKETTVAVTIPFAKNIVWRGGGNRRNLPIFLDIVKAFAVMRIKQRVECGKNTIEATIEDFNDAHKLYCYRAETQTTKLNDFELKVIHILSSSGDMDTTQLQEATNTYQSKIHNVMHGRDGRGGGLLAKVPELRYEQANVQTMTDDGHTKTVRKNLYSVRGFDVFGSYSDVVSLNKNGDKPVVCNTNVKKQVVDLMDGYKDSFRYYNTNRGFSMIKGKLEDKSIDANVIESAIASYKKEAGL